MNDDILFTLNRLVRKAIFNITKTLSRNDGNSDNQFAKQNSLALPGYKASHGNLYMEIYRLPFFKFRALYRYLTTIDQKYITLKNVSFVIRT